MEFLDKFVIPQSFEHIQLLHYLATLVLFLFVPFISIVFGSTILSLFFRKKGTAESDKGMLCYAKDLSSMFTVNKSVGIVLGIIPLLTILIIYVQLLHSTGNLSITYIFVSLLLITVALIFIYTYRYSMSFNLIFNSIQNFEPKDKSVSGEINKFSKASRNLSMKAGTYGVVLLLLAVWFLLAGLDLSLYPANANTQNLFAELFSISVIARLLTFLSFAMALTGSAILFRFFFWESGIKDIDEEYKTLVKKSGIKVTFYFSALIPIFLSVNLATFPKDTLSTSIFIYAGLVLFILFICYNILYAIIKNEKSNLYSILFMLLIISLCFSLTKDQIAMDNATKLQTLKLGDKYEVLMASLMGETKKAPKINGEEVFKVRCTPCHSFDHKIVGPPYNETLPKYVGKLNALVSFILNPKKVDAGYPPMPNPGLKPAEAKAVAKYILETYKK